VSVLRDGIVITRKEHRCHGCTEVILKGTPTYSQTNIYDGIYTLYMCNDCKDYCKLQGCNDCYIYEDAYSGYIKECRREIQRRDRCKAVAVRRDCPQCGKKAYNDVDIDKPEHDFCEICGWNL
jgi:hypothetical protein